MNRKFTIGFAALFSLYLLSACNSNAGKPDTTAVATAEPQTQETESQTTNTAPAAAASATPAAVLPNFTFYQLRSGIRVTNENLAKDINTVFILFDPGCSHCQHEAADLEKNRNRLSDVNIYYISMNNPAMVLGFFDSFAPNLSKSQHVEVLIDKDQEFIRKIHVPDQFPANYVYGPDGKLKAHWEGDKDINAAIAEFHK